MSDPDRGSHGGLQPEPNLRDDDLAVTSEPVEMEDGRTVVIQQQNVGPDNQVGGGEFKNEEGRSVEDAALDQLELESDDPVPDDDAEAPRRANEKGPDESPA